MGVQVKTLRTLLQSICPDRPTTSTRLKSAVAGLQIATGEHSPHGPWGLHSVPDGRQAEQDGRGAQVLRLALHEVMDLRHAWRD